MSGKGLKIGLSVLCLLGAVVVFAMTREVEEEDYSMEPASDVRVEEAAEQEWEGKTKKEQKAAPSKRIREDIG
jgi:hypothetical protein